MNTLRALGVEQQVALLFLILFGLLMLASIVAVLRNTGAFFIYGLMWMAMSFAAGLALLLLTVLTGSASIASFGLMPIAIMIAAMFFSSLWFTFRDSFTADEETPSAAPQQ